MYVRRTTAELALTGFCTILGALACNSRGSLRVVASDAAQPADSSTVEDVAEQDESGGSDGHGGSASLPPGEEAGSEGGSSPEARGFDTGGALDAADDAKDDQDAMVDLPVIAGDDADGGSDNGGKFLCNFFGVFPSLTCSDGEYCMSFMSGVPGDGGASYSCAAYPEACLRNPSCECLCRSVDLYPGWQCPGSYGWNYCHCIVSQGSITLLCGGA